MRFSGGHDLGFAAVLRIAEQLGSLPRDVTIWAIEVGQSSDPAGLNENLSPEVAAAVARVVELVAAEFGPA